MSKAPESIAVPALSPKSLLLAAGASLALAAFVPNPVHAAPPDGEGHEMTTDSPELAADRARALERAEQGSEATGPEQQQRREDAAAEPAQADPSGPGQSAQATPRTVNPLAPDSSSTAGATSGSTAASPDYLPAPGSAAAEAPSSSSAGDETERSGATVAPSRPSATNWSEEGKDMPQSGSSSAGAPLARTPAPGGVPGENAADPLTAPSPVPGEVPTTDAAQPSTPPVEGGASVVPDAERVDR